MAVMPAGTLYTGGGTRTLTGHERMTNQADADALREAADALREARRVLSYDDPRLGDFADKLSEEACALEDANEVRL